MAWASNLIILLEDKNLGQDVENTKLNINLKSKNVFTVRATFYVESNVLSINFFRNVEVEGTTNIFLNLKEKIIVERNFRDVFEIGVTNHSDVNRTNLSPIVCHEKGENF